MNYLEYRSIKATESIIYLVLKQDSVMVARLTDGKWRSSNEDFSVTSQVVEEISFDLHNQAVKLQEEDLQRLYDNLESLKEEIQNTPAFILEKQGSLNTYQEQINLGLENSEYSSQWLRTFQQEQKQLNKVKSELEKLSPYHKLFQQVFKGLNPKSKRNVFEINTKLFLSELLVKDLPSLPLVDSVDYISKAFFKKEQGSVQNILSDLV